MSILCISLYFNNSSNINNNDDNVNNVNNNNNNNTNHNSSDNQSLTGSWWTGVYCCFKSLDRNSWWLVTWHLLGVHCPWQSQQEIRATQQDNINSTITLVTTKTQAQPNVIRRTCDVSQLPPDSLVQSILLPNQYYIMHTVASTPVTADALWAEVRLVHMSAQQMV